MADDLAAELDRIARELRTFGANGNDAERLLKAVEAVLELHQPHTRRQNWPPVCSYDNRRWPCPEVAAITTALAGEETGDEH